VSDERRRWDADEAAERTRDNSPPYVGLYIGQPERATAALAEWQRQHPRPPATLAQVADHIEHLRAVAGIDHVGIGSDFDGIDDTPVGLAGVDRYPALLEELMRRGWSDGDIAKLAGGNVLRVMAEVEQAAARLHDRPPAEAVFHPEPKSAAVSHEFP
jgi:membrane dipeptidase